VSVRQGGYDTHAGNFRRLKEVLLPEFDRAFAGLLQDLDQRGLLETTLVIALGEFGRTPRINRQAGRDHHASAWSIVLAGAGLRGGRVLGATDKTGGEVTDLPVSPADLVRSIHAILGADPVSANLTAVTEFTEVVGQAVSPACTGQGPAPPGARGPKLALMGADPAGSDVADGRVVKELVA
jgi:uncharacterized protein (DUF1501 family)